MRVACLALLMSFTVTSNSGIAFAQDFDTPVMRNSVDLRELEVNLQQNEVSEVLLAEEWTIDYTDESQPVIGRITGAESRDDGAVLILDEQQCRVFEFGPDGTFRRTLGRPGEGPGETRGAYNVCALPEGRTAIIEGAPPMVMRSGAKEIIVLDRLGQPEGQFSIIDENRDGVMPMLRGARFANGLFLVGVHTAKVMPPDFVQVNRLMLVDEDGNRVATLAERSHAESFTATESREVDVFSPYQYYRFDLSSDGRIAYLPERDKYEVVIVEWPARRGLAIRTDLPGRERTESDLEASLQRSGFSGTPVRWVACTRDPVIDQLRFAPNGDLWVYRDARETSRDKRDFFVVDVYSRANELTKCFILKVPGDRETDLLLPLRNGTYVIVRNAHDRQDGGGDVDASVSLLVHADQSSAQ